MPVELALYQPDIPQNTGTLIRLSACLGFDLHIIHPTGFAFSDRHLRRSAMDYAETARIVPHDSFDRFDAWRRENHRRLVLMSTKADDSAYEFIFSPTDILLAGRETGGVPDEVAKTADTAVRIPMQAGMRSLNVAIASSMLMGEALRQTSAMPDGNPHEIM